MSDGGAANLPPEGLGTAVPPSSPPPAPAPPAPPRLWTALVAAAALLPCMIVVSGAALAVGMVLDGALGIVNDTDALSEWVMRFVTTPLGFVLLFVLPQACFLAMAVVPAALSPVPFRRRLGLVRGRLPLWSYPILVAATPAVAVAGYGLMRIWGEGLGEQLEMLMEAFAAVHGPLAVVLVVFLSVGPGLAEECVFRGYLQTRLLQRWHPAAAIAVTSLLFSAAHLDLQHSTAVLPGAIWLGVIAWRAGSIWPAILCHAGNNFLGILAIRLAGPGALTDPRLEAIDLVLLGITAIAFAASLVILARARPADR